MEGDTLGFPPLAPEHSGVYVCHVSNELSSRDSQVTVEVVGKPWGRHRDQEPGAGGHRSKTEPTGEGGTVCLWGGSACAL